MSISKPQTPHESKELLLEFSGDHFDPKMWINQHLCVSSLQNNKKEPQKSPKDQSSSSTSSTIINNNNNNITENNKISTFSKQHTSKGNNSLIPATQIEALAEMIRQLQTIQFELEMKIESGTQQTLRSVPKSMLEIGIIQKEALLLKEKVSSYNKILEQIELETNDALKVISQLDHIKQKIELVLSKIHTSQHLMEITGSIENLMSSQNLKKIASELAKVRQDLAILKGVPHFDQTSLNLQRWETRLETMCKPQIREQIANENVEKSLEFFQILQNLKKESVILEEYYSSRSQAFIEQWNLFDSSKETFAKWLPEFFQHILFTTSSQIKWTAEVFKSADNCEIVATLLYRTFSKIAQSFHERLALHKTDLEQLTQIYSTTQKFVDSLQPSKLTPDEVLNQIFSPFYEYQTGYAQLEMTYLQGQLKPIPSNLPLDDSLEKVRQTISSMFYLLEQALERNQEFTSCTESRNFVETANVNLFSDQAFLHRSLNLKIIQSRVDIISKLISDKTSSSSFQSLIQMLQISNNLNSRTHQFDAHLKNYLLSGIKPKPSLQEQNPNRLLYAAYLHFQQDKLGAQKLQELTQDLRELSYYPLNKGKTASKGLCASVSQALFMFAFSPIQEQLDAVPTFKEWTHTPKNSLAPTFSLSQMGYISKVGQHLLHLLQQLEPFSSEDSGLVFDIQALVETLPVLANSGKSLDFTPQDENDSVFQWINIISQTTMLHFVSKVLEIRKLSDYGTRQLVADVSYLTNVLTAIGIDLNKDLITLKQYLEKQSDFGLNMVPHDELWVAKTVYQMRGLHQE